MSQRVCAFDGCGEPFVPTGPLQRYHTIACRDANAAAERRRRARVQARQGKDSRDEIASAFMEASAPPLLAVITDAEREALERSQAVGVTQLHSTVRGVAGAHAEGDAVALRGELVQLAAQALVWAATLPAPVRRRRRVDTRGVRYAN